MTDKHVCICKYMKHTYKHTQVYTENDGKWKAEIEALFMKENKFVLMVVKSKGERERKKSFTTNRRYIDNTTLLSIAMPITYVFNYFPIFSFTNIT